MGSGTVFSSTLSISQHFCGGLLKMIDTHGKPDHLAEERRALRPQPRILFEESTGAVMFEPLQKKAVMLEPYLMMRTAMDHCDGWCANKAIDARGMTAEPNFLYVVINDIDCQSRLAPPDPSE